MSVCGDRARWLRAPRRLSLPTCRLVCLGYAGGGAHLFRDWPEYLPPGVEVLAVQLPARGDRSEEPPAASIREIAHEVAIQLGGLPEAPLVLFGHSMGGLIAFEVARLVEGSTRAVCISGQRPADKLVRAEEPLHELPDAELVEFLSRFNGIPVHLAKRPALIEAFLPSLRADLRLAEEYRYREAPPLDCQIQAFAGRDDPVAPPDAMRFWRRHAANFSLRVLPGDHFFIHSCEPVLLSYLADATLSP